MILDFVPIIIFEERVFAQPLGAIARTLGLPEHGFDAPFDRLIVPDVSHESDFVSLAIDEGARDLVALVQNPALTIAQALANSFALKCWAIQQLVRMVSTVVSGTIGRKLGIG